MLDSGIVDMRNAKLNVFSFWVKRSGAEFQGLEKKEISWLEEVFGFFFLLCIIRRLLQTSQI